MELLVYEHLTGGGLLADHDAPWSTLAAEGQAMVTALTGDFARLGGVAVTCLRDGRVERQPLPGCRWIEVNNADEHRREFDRCAAAADWTVVIAPEIDGNLLDRCRRVNEVGGRLLGPSLDLVALASNKQRTAERLQAAGLSVPRGRSFASGDAWPRDFHYPAVWKPRDGAGSVGILLVEDWRSSARPPTGQAGRLEEFRRGLPASVALVCGPAGCTALPACRQHISDDGRLRYLGGSVPLPSPYAERAARLAERVIAAIEKPLGYLGVDLVLGKSSDGSDDVVIEINPRLTTSYLGLRALCRQNLAGAMLDAALGRPLTLSFGSEEIRFGIGNDASRDRR